jgi:hypothetical protein
MSQVNGYIYEDFSAHLGPTVAKEPVFGKIMAFLYSTVKKRICHGVLF